MLDHELSGVIDQEMVMDWPLVTNTESYTTCEAIKSLQVPSPVDFDKLASRSKRYVLQSVIKEILGACEKPLVDINGSKVKHKYHRLGACKQLSTVFNPNNWVANKRDFFDVSRRWHEEMQEHVSMATINYRETEGGNGVEAHFGGLCRCDGVWVCPVCAPIIAEYRAKEIAQAMYLHQKADGYVVFVTFTVRHKRHHTIGEVLNCLRQSATKTKQGNQWSLFKRKYGLVGNIRSSEYTYTLSNGHHPHLHELWFFEEKPDLKAIKDWVYKRYARYVVKHDGFESPSYKNGVDMRYCLSSRQRKTDGFDIKDVDSIARYVSKGSDVDRTLSEVLVNRPWGAPEEMTKNQYKVSNRSSDGVFLDSYNSIALATEYMFSQYELNRCLDEMPENVDYIDHLRKRIHKFKSLYIDYADAFFGTRQLYWSRGLKERFDVYEMEDKAINETFEEGLNELMVLDIEYLQKIIKYRLKGEVLNIVESDGYKTDEERVNAVTSFLDGDSLRRNRYG